MPSPVRQVELALVERLRAPRPYNGLLVESYGGQLDDELFSWVRTLPAVWVTFDKISGVRKIGRTSRLVTADFEVLAAQRNLGENDRRLNAVERGQDVGLYELLEDNKLLLAGRKLGLQIQPIEPGVLKPVMKGVVSREAVAIYAQTFTTSWVEQILDDDEGDTVDLLRVGLDYLLKPGDETPDSSDLVTLGN